MAFQRTIARPVSMEGVGLHTGEPCSLTIRPAPVESGIVFLPAGPRAKPIPAATAHSVELPLRTALTNGQDTIFTVEHLLAAFWGMEIDGAEIEISGPEIPAADGSALPFVELLTAAGAEESDVPRRVRHLQRPVWLDGGDTYALALPSHGMRVTCAVDFPAPVGKQLTAFELTPETFAREIAPARTFAFEQDIAEIRAHGLAQGGTLDNALLISTDGYSSPLRFPDEVVRHKALDLLGDLALMGARAAAEIVAVRCGHRWHHALAREILHHSDPA
jgi:UDP-3-O-acyl N-acetylglucosamine deacetylase